MGKNILLINIFYFPNMVGGTENSIKILCEELVKRGNNVSVYTLDGGVPGLTTETINGVNVFRGYFKPLNKKLSGSKLFLGDKLNECLRLYINRKSNHQIKEIIKDENISVIHTNNLRYITHWIWRYARRNHIRLVHTVRDYWLIDPKATKEETNFLVDLFFSSFFKRLSNNVSNVTGASNYTLKTYKTRGYFKNAKYTTIANSLRLDINEINKHIDFKLLKSNPKKRFLYAGRLTEEKGVNLLLSAIKDIPSKNVEFVICGEGPLINKVKNMTQRDERVIYKGQLAIKELEAEYINSDVMIIPSIWSEPFGRIIIEAAKYGVPAIATNRGGIPEIMETLDVGVLIEPELCQLVSAINLLLNDEILRLNIKKISCNIMNYDIGKQVDAFEKLFLIRED